MAAHVQRFPNAGAGRTRRPLALGELITARIALEQVNEGFDALKRGAANRSVVVF
jgi:S-(hydroxymethyl)glutathione dehydrogenase/alcohol dehydrogenase